MANIHVLDFQVANLIAAGEVVDRPASVAKELLENAIDAGATRIIIEIKRGGVAFLRVTDNGCGMAKEDVPIALKRHATSKIQNADDLDGIVTLGFRGEALAAISSVATVRILTKRKSDAMGTLLTSEAGQAPQVSEAGCMDGTTVIIEELFRNVPARRKFLKKDATEGLAVAAVVEKIALSRPDISVQFISEGTTKFETAGDGKLQNAVYAVLGRDFARKMIDVQAKTDGIEVSGYIGSPENVRPNRNQQIFFLNGRYVKSKTAMAALEQAFDSYIPSDKFPACVLHIVIHPAFVDVNVHPAKLEVKFSNERLVFEAVYMSVRDALVRKINHPTLEPQPIVPEKKATDYTRAFVPVYDRTAETDRAPQVSQVTLEETVQSQASASKQVEQTAQSTKTTSFLDFDIPKIPLEILQMAPSAHSTVSEAEKPAVMPLEAKKESAPALQSKPVAPSAIERPKRDLPTYRYLGEAFHCYLFVEVGDQVLVIDKHAAHERILFEQMKANMQALQPATQVLLVPLTVNLTVEEYAAFAEYEKEITALGFTFASHKEGKLEVAGIPVELNAESAISLLTVIADRLAAGTGTAALSREILYEKALYQASCKAAIKGGRAYDDVHHIWIIEQVLCLPDIKYCPHGRPIAFAMEHSWLERKFGRE